MKSQHFKLFSLLITCLLYFVCSTCIEAQQFPVKVGSLGEVRSSLRTSPNAKASGTQTIKIDNQLFRINSQVKTDENIQLSGYYESEHNTLLQLTVSDDKLEGDIVNIKQKTAFRYYSDANGDIFKIKEDINNLLCSDYASESEIKQANTRAASSSKIAAITAPPASSTVYSLQSFSTARAVIYLDFDGQVVSGTYWNVGQAINALPSNFDENGIREIYRLVAEDYRPFNVNVTTSEAVYLAAPANLRTRCIFTPTYFNDMSGILGVARLNSFISGVETPCWVFTGNVKHAGESASHEVGHTLGLEHDRTLNSSTNVYFDGTGHEGWAPIMGSSINATLGQWSKGEYAQANNSEDDLAIMTGPGKLTYRTDGDRNTLSTARALVLETNGQLLASKNSGIITQASDVDYFSFTIPAEGANLNIIVNPAASNPNLDVLFRILNTAGTPVVFSNPNFSLSANIITSLSAGTYYLEIDGTGKNNPLSNGYSDYGSLGEYSISGNITSANTLRTAEAVNNCNQGVLVDYITGIYNTLPSFSGLTPTNSVNSRDISLLSIPNNNSSNYAARFTTYIQVPTDGQYTFFTNSSGGSKLYIGSQLVVNNDGNHALQEQSGRIGLRAGRHLLIVEYFRHATVPQLQVSYSSSAITKRAIPESILCQNARIPENPTNCNASIRFAYYKGTFSLLPNFNTLTSLRSGNSVQINLSTIGADADPFAVRYNGYIDVPYHGTYTFFTNSKDGSKLLIGSQLVVSNDGLHALQERSGNIYLQKGKHAITIEYFSNGVSPSLSASYRGPGITKRVIPASALCNDYVDPNNLTLRDPDAVFAGCNAGIHNNFYSGIFTNLPNFSTLTPLSSGINYSIGPVRNFSTTSFANLMTGYLNIPTDGIYTFFLNSKDGSKFFVGNQLVVNNDGLHSALEQSGRIGLKAGRHEIRLEYFVNNGGELLELRYESALLSKQLILYTSVCTYGFSLSNRNSDAEPQEQIRDNENRVNIQCYPQPFEHTTTISSKNGTSISSVKIINAAGVEIYSNSDINTSSLIIGEELQPGVFTAIIDTDQGSQMIRLVKIK
ncbi:MAG: PA14 domain-containing protein [Cytophagaceae bacterium]|jgi:hypothetical protein|nr:PA14 domain-containing protein [Cytophagaceae bacterium]